MNKKSEKEASSLKVGWLVAESLQATKSALERVYSYIILVGLNRFFKFRYIFYLFKIFKPTHDFNFKKNLKVFKLVFQFIIE